MTRLMMSEDTFGQTGKISGQQGTEGSGKKLLIHDLTPDEWEKTKDKYRDWTVVSETGPIRPCIGCFRCWTGGNGQCVFKDGYDSMCTLIHEAEEVCVMSRYVYGGFSAFVKNVFDRSIGYVLPELETAYGEMHHKKRFPGDKLVTFVFRGSGLSEEDRERARAYAAAVIRNLRGSVKEVLFTECAPIETPVAARAFGARSGILLINGSVRKERSNTAVFLNRLLERLGPDAKAVSLSLNTDLNAVADIVKTAKTVVLGLPLYVDGIPASAIRLMEVLKKENAGEGCRLYAVVNNGLYESRQNVNLLSMVRDYCRDAGFLYCGAAAIGAGEAVGTIMRSKMKSLWPARNAERSLARLSKAVSSGLEAGETYADPFLFPRFLYILIANANWKRLKKRDRRERA